MLRTLPTFALVVALIAVGCDLAALCATAQASQGKCCCPVAGPSPCLDDGTSNGASMPDSQEASLENGKPAPTGWLDDHGQAAPSRTSPRQPPTALQGIEGLPATALFLSHCSLLC